LTNEIQTKIKVSSRPFDQYGRTIPAKLLPLKPHREKTKKTSSCFAYAANARAAGCLTPKMASASCASLFFARKFDSKFTHFRIVFGLQFLKCHPVETIHPLVGTKLAYRFYFLTKGKTLSLTCSSSSKIQRILGLNAKAILARNVAESKN